MINQKSDFLHRFFAIFYLIHFVALNPFVFPSMPNPGFSMIWLNPKPKSVPHYWFHRYCQRAPLCNLNQYRVILKNVSFGIFRTSLVSKEEKNFTIESRDKGLSLSKFSWYLVNVKIIKIRHSKGHTSQKSHDSKIISM